MTWNNIITCKKKKKKKKKERLTSALNISSVRRLHFFNKDLSPSPGVEFSLFFLFPKLVCIARLCSLLYCLSRGRRRRKRYIHTRGISKIWNVIIWGLKFSWNLRDRAIHYIFRSRVFLLQTSFKVSLNQASSQVKF